MFEKWRSLRNEVDFFFRSKLRFERALPPDFEIPHSEQKFQKEISEFFDLLKIKDRLNSNQKDWIVCDVGTKNFSIALVLDQIFQHQNKTVEIHGIEIDAYRRFSNFYTRADYARYFAEKARNAHFHSMDFQDFQKPADIIFLLNPFVSKEPLLAWGLPLRFFRPKEIFEKAKKLLEPKQGFLVLGCPSEDELEISSTYALEAGFQFTDIVAWKPSSQSVQKKARYGRICLING